MVHELEKFKKQAETERYDLQASLEEAEVPTRGPVTTRTE